jgi:hypothetical protein
MKLRMGFVSNSSGSSYIVTIHTSLANVIADMTSEYGWDLFSKEKLEKGVNKRIKEANEAYQNDRSGIMKSMSEHWIADAKRDKDALDKIGDSKEALFATVMEFNGIKVTDHKASVVLEASTSMHNDFDDVPRLLREIVLYYIFDTDYQVICKRIDES